MSWYAWVVFLHVFAAFGFFLAHGAATAMAFAVRRDRNLERVRALLDASSLMMPALFASLLLVLASGVALGFLGGWWRMGWIWASLALLVVLSVWMGWYSAKHYGPLRRAAGMKLHGEKPGTPLPEPDPTALDRLALGTSPWTLLVGGLGGWGVILWLMMFKPW